MEADDKYSIEIEYYGDYKSISYKKDDKYFNAPDKGYARADFSYTTDGMLYFVQFKGQDGLPADSILTRFSSYLAIYSPNALLLREEYRNREGKLVCPRMLPYAYIEAKNDIDDTIIENFVYYDEDGRPLTGFAQK